jgi:hypothetical protein
MDNRTAAEKSVDEVDSHWNKFIATNDMTHLRAAVDAAHKQVDSGIDPADVQAVRATRQNH